MLSDTKRFVVGLSPKQLGLALMLCCAVLFATRVRVDSTTYEDANREKAQAQILAFRTAIVSYKLAMKAFPENLEQLVHDPRRSFLYAEEVPMDPWGRPYIYSVEGDDFRIVSYGADGVVGGVDDDQDIDTKDLNNDEWQPAAGVTSDLGCSVSRLEG